MENRLIPFVDRVIRIRGVEPKSPEVLSQEYISQKEFHQAQLDIVAPYSGGILGKSDDLDVTPNTQFIVVKKDFLTRKPRLIKGEQRWSVEEPESIDGLNIQYKLQNNYTKDINGKSLQRFSVSMSHTLEHNKATVLSLGFDDNMISSLSLNWHSQNPETLRALNRGNDLQKILNDYLITNNEVPYGYNSMSVSDGGFTLYLGMNPSLSMHSVISLRTNHNFVEYRPQFVYSREKNKLIRATRSNNELSYPVRFGLKITDEIPSQTFLSMLYHSLQLIPADTISLE